MADTTYHVTHDREIFLGWWPELRVLLDHTDVKTMRFEAGSRTHRCGIFMLQEAEGVGCAKCGRRRWSQSGLCDQCREEIQEDG